MEQIIAVKSWDDLEDRLVKLQSKTPGGLIGYLYRGQGDSDWGQILHGNRQTTIAIDYLRRVSLIPMRPGDGLLIEPKAGAQLWRRERVFVPHCRPSHRSKGEVYGGGNASCLVGCPCFESVIRSHDTQHCVFFSGRW